MDVLDRHVDEHGRLHTTRLVGTEGFLPSWVCSMIGINNTCYAYEHSVVDPEKKTMIMGSRNMTLSGWVDVEETLTYSQHEDDDKWVVQMLRLCLNNCSILSDNFHMWKDSGDAARTDCVTMLKMVSGSNCFKNYTSFWPPQLRSSMGKMTLPFEDRSWGGQKPVCFWNFFWQRTFFNI